MPSSDAGLDPTPDAGSDAGSDASSSLVCPAVLSTSAPPIKSCSSRADGTTPVIDDFEDGTLVLPSSEGRHGGWYTFTDGTTGCISAEVMSDSSSLAMHVAGGGFEAGRAGFGTALDWSNTQQGFCTYDVSAYAGIRFRARGKGQLRVTFPSRETSFESAGGSCPDSNGCFDRQGRSVILMPAYHDFVVPFCSLSQLGFGPAFGPQNLADMTSVNFLISTTGDFDVWIDDVAFVPRQAGQVDVCGPVCSEDEVPLGIVPQPTMTSLDEKSTGVQLHTFAQATKDCGPVTRRYLSYAPSSLTSPTDAPVVIVLHGSGADAESMRGFVTQSRFEALADRDGFVVVYGNAAPSAATVPERPNGGSFRKTVGADTEINDVVYLELIVQDLVSRGAITGRNPVFLAGLSDGGGLVHIAGINDSSRYSGLALVSPYPGSLPELPTSTPDSIIKRVLLAYSLADPGLPAGFPPELVPLGPAWARAIGVPASAVDAPTEIELPDLVQEGRGYTGSLPNALSTEDSRAAQLEYGSDPAGPICRVLRFDHAGHLWPIPSPLNDASVIGQFGFRNQDMDMADVVWTFFKSALTTGTVADAPATRHLAPKRR